MDKNFLNVIEQGDVMNPITLDLIVGGFSDSNSIMEECDHCNTCGNAGNNANNSIHKFLFQWAKIFNEDVPCQNEMAHSL